MGDRNADTNNTTTTVAITGSVAVDDETPIEIDSESSSSSIRSWFASTARRGQLFLLGDFRLYTAVAFSIYGGAQRCQLISGRCGFGKPILPWI